MVGITSSNISSLATSTSAVEIEEASNAAANLDFDTYLTLLVTQLENQDPLDPMDPNEMTAQIATYSQIEQQLQSNKYLEDIASQQGFGEQSLAVSYIGKEVLVPGNDIAVTEGNDVDFGYELEGFAVSSLIQIRNSDGVLVHQFDGATASGLHQTTWDGTDSAGDAVAAGDYAITVSATDADGNIVEANAHVYRQVTAVDSEEDNLTLTLADNTQVSFNDARTVRALEEN